MKFLLFLSIFLLPFNGLPVVSFGLIAKQGAFYALMPFTLLSIVLTFIYPRNFLKVNKGFMLLALLLLCWVFISFLYNSQLIVESSYLDRLGTTRFIEQLIQLVFGLMVAVAIANQVRTKKDYMQLIGVIRFCVVFVLIFGFMQALGYKLGGFFLDLQITMGSLILPDGLVASNYELGGRLHSVSQEPSMLSGFLITLAPFIISFSLKKRRVLLPGLIVLALLASGSRMGYLVFFLQMCILMIFYRRQSLSALKIITFAPVILFLSFLLMLTPAGDVVISLFTITELGSNATRYAGLVSGVLLWLDNSLLFGVGLGQYGFYAADYMPDWGLITHETLAEFGGDKWPYTHNMYITLLAEIGLVGLILFVSMFLSVLISINSFLKKNIKIDDDVKLIGYSSFVSLFGTLLTLFSREPLSNFNLWISIGLALMFLSVARRSLTNRDY